MNTNEICGQATVAIVVGGGLSVITRNLEILGVPREKAVCVFFDVGMEMGIGDGGDVVIDGNVITVPLAVNQTVRTLAENFGSDGRFDVALRALQGKQADLDQGLGRTPILGYMVHELLKQSLSTKVWSKVLDLVRMTTGGKMTKIRVMSFASNSGGTGRGLSLEVTKSLVEYLLRYTNAVVHTELYRLGTETFTGIGPHTRWNNAPGVAADAYWALMLDHHPRDVRSMLGFEAPMDGLSHEKRERHTGYGIWALQAPGTRRNLKLDEVNRFMTRPLGRLMAAQFGFWDLSKKFNEVASLSASLLSKVEALVAEDSEKAEVKVETFVSASVARVGNHKEVVAICEDHTRFFDEDPWKIIRSEYETHGSATAVVFGEQMPFGNSVVVRIPESLADYRRQRAVLYSLRAVVRGADLKEIGGLQKEAQDKIDDLKIDLEDAADDIRGHLKAIFPKGVVQKILSPILLLLKNREARALELEERCLPAFAEIEKDLAIATANLELLKGAEVAIARAIATLEAYVTNLKGWLEALSKAGGARQGLLFVRPLEEVFKILVQSRARNDRRQFEYDVMASIQGITPDALGIMLGVDGNDVQAVASALKANPPEIAPAWGGYDDPMARPMAVVVIPPVDKGYADQLSVALDDINGPTLVVAENASAGVSGVAVNITDANDNLDAFWTTTLKADYQEVFKQGLDPVCVIPGQAKEEDLKQLADEVICRSRRQGDSN